MSSRGKTLGQANCESFLASEQIPKINNENSKFEENSVRSAQASSTSESSGFWTSKHAGIGHNEENVMPYIETKNGKWKTKKHIETTGVQEWAGGANAN